MGEKKDEPYTGSVVGFLEEASDEDEVEEVVPKEARPAKKRVRATFKVRVYAKKKNVELDRLTGTGANGRVTEADVDRASK